VIDADTLVVEAERQCGNLAVRVRHTEMERPRFAGFERGLAIAGLFIASIGVTATVVQAWAAVASLP